MRRLGLITATMSATAVALVAPAAGQAAPTTIGYLANAGEMGGPPTPSCAVGRVFTQTTTNGSAGGATFDLPNSPTVITGWATTFRASPGVTSRQGALKVLGESGGTFTILATSPVQTLVATGVTSANVNRFSVRIPTPGGGQLAYAPAGADPTPTCYIRPEDGGADPNGNAIGHGLSSGAVGTTFTPDTNLDDFRMSIQATFEADGDVDGFGDDTQDRCLGIAGENEGCPIAAAVLPPPPPDTTKPLVARLSFSRTSFAAAKSGAAYTAQRGKKKRKKPSAPVGTKVSFGLTEAASVKFTVERKASGRRVSGKCKTRTRKNRKKAKCTLWKKVTGSFTFTGKAGANSFTFRGRIGGKSLKTGDYRLIGTATDAARNVSKPTNKAFKIVK